MLVLMARIPEMSDIVIAVLAARRRRSLETGEASLTLIGAETSRDIRAVASFAARNKIPARSLSLTEAATDPAVLKAGLDVSAPALVFGQNELLTPPIPRRPSPAGWALILISTATRSLMR